METQTTPDKDLWSIHCLYVHPDFRGQGVSSLLLEAARGVAKDQGAKRLLAFPIPEDTRHKFPANEAEFSGRMSTFVRYGFKKERRLSDLYEIMSLAL